MRMRCLFFPLCSAIALTSFVQAQSLEKKARLLFAREQEYHRRLRNIDI